MDKEILQALEDSEFAETILDCLSAEEVQECFESINISISDEDAEKILCSVYGVEEEAKFMNDYDLALCAGGQSAQVPAAKTEIFNNEVVQAIGLQKVIDKFKNNSNDK